MSELIDGLRPIVDDGEKRWLREIVSAIQRGLQEKQHGNSFDLEDYSGLLTSNFTALQSSGSQPFKIFTSLMIRVSLAVKMSWGYYPRKTQLLAVSVLLQGFLIAQWRTPGKPMKGRLIEMATGEGKTVVVAMFAASICLLAQQKVDIVTSADALAQRDAKETLPYFTSLGLSVAHSDVGDMAIDLQMETEVFLQEHSTFRFLSQHLDAWCRKRGQGVLPMSMEDAVNRKLYEGSTEQVRAAWREHFPEIDRPPLSLREAPARDENYSPKTCYKANVVYGTAMSFQGDLLRHELKAMGTRDISRGRVRPLDTVICDECDSLQVSRRFRRRCSGANLKALFNFVGSRDVWPIMLVWISETSLIAPPNPGGRRGPLNAALQQRVWHVVPQRHSGSDLGTSLRRQLQGPKG